MKDLRKFTRKSLHCMVSVFDGTGVSKGNLVDYSDGGIMVASYQPIPTEQTFEFAMVDLPNNIGRKRTGKIKVESVWSQQLTNTMYGTGFLLIDADDEAKTMFASYDEQQDN